MSEAASDSPEVHPSAVVDDGARLGARVRVWHFCHICSGATLGEGSSLGQGCYVGPGVQIGPGVRVQNHVSIFEGTVVEAEVFLGPSCVLTNVSNPRAGVCRRGLYEETRLGFGATVGANATVVCGVHLGKHAFVAAGSVLTSDAPDYALMVGVPAKRTGWMSRHGHRLHFDAAGLATCPEGRLRYVLKQGRVRCLDLAETESLPSDLSDGRGRYREFRDSSET